jgi:hypothetical protein
VRTRRARLGIAQRQGFALLRLHRRALHPLDRIMCDRIGLAQMLEQG